MSKDLQIFKNNEFGKIRTILIGDKPYFVGSDIARALGYKKPNNAINQHCKGALKQGIPTKGGNQQMNCIPEGDVYRLIVNSELPRAEKFETWVFDEVLPTVRKHGAYLTDKKIEEVLTDPDTIIELATQLKEEREERKLLQQQAKEDKPKVLFAEAVEDSDDVILVKEMATILTQRGFDIGQNQLFQYLRDNEYLCKRKGDMWNAPTKKYEHLFKVTKRIIQNSKGSMVKNTPKITGRGQLYFMKKFDEYLQQGITIKDLLEEEV